jgi:putative redox protein
MQIHINYAKNLQFQASAREHNILGDQPIESGGDDVGMTPPEWFLASLGSCIGFYAVKYCQARELDATGLSIDVSAQKPADPPARLDDIQICLSLPIDLGDRHRQGLEKVVNACLIHNTLTHPPTITTQILDGSISRTTD